jgi:hypothetical protein
LSDDDYSKVYLSLHDIMSAPVDLHTFTNDHRSVRSSADLTTAVSTVVEVGDESSVYDSTVVEFDEDASISILDKVTNEGEDNSIPIKDDKAKKRNRNVAKALHLLGDTRLLPPKAQKVLVRNINVCSVCTQKFLLKFYFVYTGVRNVF